MTRSAARPTTPSTPSTPLPSRWSIEVAAPFGRLLVVADQRCIVGVSWGNEPTDSEHVQFVAAPSAHPVLLQAVRELNEYFAGTRRQFEVPVRLAGTAFQQQAWAVLRGIPYGSTISYGEQARRLGNSRAVRAVGGANGRNPVGIIVPCHRVIGADGSLTGFGGGVQTKRWLLDHEQRVLGPAH